MKKLAWFIILIASIACIFAGLSFAFEPYRSSSDDMWQQYAATKDIDTIYTGSSQAMCALHPAVLDAALGSHSFNMATNMQSFTSSYDAITTAASSHALQRVVLVIDWELMGTARADNFRAEASYYHAKGKTLSLPGKFTNALSLMTDPEMVKKPISLTYLAPWTYNRSSSIVLNMREKLAGTVLDPEGHRDADGFFASDQILEREGHYITLAEAKDWSAKNTLTQPTILDENLTLLRDLCRSCEENGIDLIVMEVPVPNVFSFYDFEGYRASNHALAALCEEESADFYNFNLLKADAYSNDLSGYKDVGHMNTQGADAFSAFFARFLQERDADPNAVTSYFQVLPSDL